jgi:hypothetical protein
MHGLRWDYSYSPATTWGLLKLPHLYTSKAILSSEADEFIYSFCLTGWNNFNIHFITVLKTNVYIHKHRSKVKVKVKGKGKVAPVFN